VYSKGQTLPTEVIDGLNAYWENNSDSRRHRNEMGNVVNVEYMDLKNSKDPDILEAQFLLSDLAKQHLTETGESSTIVPHIGFYMLEYGAGSFTSMHVDGQQGGIIGATTICLLTKSDDLCGGSIVVDDNGALSVVDQDVNEVVIYNSDVMHGVSKLVSGTRRVIVCWFQQG